MASIGIRELRQNASRYIRRVKAGETMVVTDRGEPVAQLTPLTKMSPLERLIADGKVIPARVPGGWTASAPRSNDRPEAVRFPRFFKRCATKMTDEPGGLSRAPGIVYLDASALVKLVVEEPESPALTAFLGPLQLLASSVIAIVEVRRAALRSGIPEVAERARFTLDRLILLPLVDDVTELASTVPPATLRSLDAIHIASARALGSELEAIVTCDTRMAAAARFLGLKVAAPA